MKRFITYLDDLAKRTYFGLVILPAMAAATLYHWIFD